MRVKSLTLQCRERAGGGPARFKGEILGNFQLILKSVCLGPSYVDVTAVYATQTVHPTSSFTQKLPDLYVNTPTTRQKHHSTDDDITRYPIFLLKITL